MNDAMEKTEFTFPKWMNALERQFWHPDNWKNLRHPVRSDAVVIAVYIDEIRYSSPPVLVVFQTPEGFFSCSVSPNGCKNDTKVVYEEKQ